MSDIHEIRVIPTEGDPVGHDVQVEAARSLGEEFMGVSTAKVYRVEGIDETQAHQLAGRLLTDPLTERYAVNQPSDFDTEHVVEVGYKPGVMNPEARSIVEAAHDMGINAQAADSSRKYAFFGATSVEQVDRVTGRLLVNDTVQHVVTEKPKTLMIKGEVGPITTVPLRNASESELADLSRDKLFLDSQGMRSIQDHFCKLGRDPKDGELETIAARWSEHCGHPTFRARVMIRQADGSYLEKLPWITRIMERSKAQESFDRLVLSAFGDNSGVIRFYDGQAICGKVETHNSPSAVEPYGGAMTGSGGVFRDIAGTGQGAKNIVSTDIFCVGPTDMDETKLPKGVLHRPDYLLRQVVRGVSDYGNRDGIPTGNGSVHFHPDFRAKPTVMVGAYGILPESMAQKGEAQLGDKVVIIGGRTGRDGIHGATFSSGEMTERTAEVNGSAVQIGDAIEEKRMFDALIEARDWGFIRAITDCGAAGFSSAVGEMGEHIGVTVDLKDVPLKYEGLSPWEMWVSESQERMVAAIPPENIEGFLEVCRKYNVEATVIGEFDGSHTLTVNYDEQNVIELDYDFLINGLPQKVIYGHWERPEITEIRPEAPKDANEWIERFKAVLAHGNVCSKEPIVRQYDHGVQGGNIVSPFGGADQSGPNDALVVRPILGKPYGMVVSHGMNPALSLIDPFKAGIWAVTEAAANYVAVGGDLAEAGGVGNYVTPYPDEETVGATDLLIDGATAMMDVLGVPVVSGKDSMSSTYRDNEEVIKIPPIYNMSIFGRIPDVERTVTTDIKAPGNSTLYLIGKPNDGMGGSTYYDVTGGSSGSLPEIDLAQLPKTLKAVQKLIKSGVVTACHDVSEGGLATAVAEMCFGGQAGVDILLPNLADRESFLFNETAGCFVVEVPNDTNIFLEFAPNEVEIMPLGPTTNEQAIKARQYSDALGYEEIFDAPVDELKAAWQQPMKELFHA